MRRRVGATIAVGAALLLVGGALVGVVRVRDRANRQKCQSNLRVLILGMDSHHDAHGQYPPAVAPHPTLPHDRRLGWQADLYILSQLGLGGGDEPHVIRFDYDRPWDDPANFPIRETFLTDGRTIRVSGIGEFLCPAHPDPGPARAEYRTEYVGLAGVGANAADLPAGHPQAGPFGFDRTATRGQVTDGLGFTAAITEAAGNTGLWPRGGPGTTRGLVPGAGPYVGPNGQFAGRHGHGLVGRTVTLWALLDGSVRPLAASADPGVLEALTTVAGGESIEVP